MTPAAEFASWVVLLATLAERYRPSPTFPIDDELGTAVTLAAAAGMGHRVPALLAVRADLVSPASLGRDDLIAWCAGWQRYRALCAELPWVCAANHVASGTDERMAWLAGAS